MEKKKIKITGGLVAVEHSDLERVLSLARFNQNCRMPEGIFYGCMIWLNWNEDPEKFKETCNNKCAIRKVYRQSGIKFTECPSEEDWAEECVATAEQWHEDYIASLNEAEGGE